MQFVNVTEPLPSDAEGNFAETPETHVVSIRLDRIIGVVDTSWQNTAVQSAILLDVTNMQGPVSVNSVDSREEVLAQIRTAFLTS